MQRTHLLMNTLRIKPKVGDTVSISTYPGSDTTHFWVSGYNSASFYANLEETEQIRDWLNQWIEERQAYLINVTWRFAVAKEILNECNMDIERWLNAKSTGSDYTRRRVLEHHNKELHDRLFAELYRMRDGE